MALTKKQKKVYDFICEYLDTQGFSPTQNEIKKHFQLKSLGSVQDYIRYLTNAGFLKNDPNAVRGLEPIREEVTPPSPEVNIPLLGQVAAGFPIEAIEGQDNISIPSNMIPAGKCFALQISGQSMIEDGILDGDIVLIKEQKTANRGDTVVATINHEATIKRYQPKSGTIELHPANSTMKPIIVEPEDHFEIKGILAGLIRSY